jgi:hypothetical protein
MCRILDKCTYYFGSAAIRFARLSSIQRSRGEGAMFKGGAELTDPEKGGVVATFDETCHDDGTAVAAVKIRTPITLQESSGR